MEEKEPLMPNFNATPETKGRDGSSYKGTELGETEGKEKINKEEKLLQVAETGNIKDIEKLIKEDGINLKYCDKNGQTALHLAAKSLHTAVCETLVKSDKSLLKIQDKNGYIPMHLSISSGKSSTKLVEFFLSNDANPKTLTRKRQTSLHLASDKGNSDIVKLFINQGVSVDDKDSEEFTALHLAAKNGHTFCCEDLVKADADINVKSKRGQTPLQLSAKSRFTSCCSFLLKSGADINIQDDDGNTALHLACSSRMNKGIGESAKFITLLLANNADPNILNKHGETSLQAAKKAPSIVFKAFENHNVNVTQTDRQGQTILHNVASRKEGTACEVILNICKQQEIDVIKFVNQQDNDDFTALHYAIKFKNADSCKALIKDGADGNILCNFHGNALHMVAEFGHEEICDFIITKGTKIDVVNSNNKTSLQIAAHKGHTKICKSLLNKNSNVLLTDSDGNTALHLTAKEGHIQCCQLLVDKNQVTVRKVNKEGKTPLHLAVINGMHECCKVLIKKKSEIWKMDQDGHSAVWYANNLQHDHTFLLLVNSTNRDQAEKDVDLNDVLKSAIEEKRRVVCEGLIQGVNWEECLKEQSSENQNFRNVLQKYPNIAKFILDKCQIKATIEEETKSTFNFIYIDDDPPTYMINEGPKTIRGFFKSLIYGWSNINSSWRANHPATLMQKMPDLLHHPVVTEWVNYKWTDYGRALHHSYSFLVLLQLFLLILYLAKSWTWTTLINKYGHNQTQVCPDGPRLVGPEVERELIKQNKAATRIGYALLVFTSLNVISFTYRTIKIHTFMVKFKTVLKLLTSLCNILVVINFTKCSQSTQLREDIQWLPGYASSGFLLLTLILTFGEHPNCSKMFFGFNTACQGASCMIALIAVVTVSYLHYEFSENIENITKMEPQTIWMIIILIISFLVILFNMFGRKSYIRRNRIRHIDLQRRLAFVSLLMDYDVLFPPLRNWSYRKEVTIDQEDQNCFNRNCMPCRTRHYEYDLNEENNFEESQFDEFSKMQTSLMEEMSKIKEQLKFISEKMEKNS